MFAAQLPRQLPRRPACVPGMPICKPVPTMPSPPFPCAADWCAYRVEDWWTYEVCYKKHVRQYHKDQNKVVSEYLLGRYNRDDDSLNEIHVSQVTVACAPTTLWGAVAARMPCKRADCSAHAVRYVQAAHLSACGIICCV